MSAVTILSAFAAHLENSEQKLNASEVVSRFLSAFFKGDRAIFPEASLDGEKDHDLVFGIWWPSPPGQYFPTYQFYGQNRMGMFERLRIYKALPTNTDWDTIKYRMSIAEDLFAIVASELNNSTPSSGLLIYANHIAFTNITGAKFLQANELTMPIGWLEGMGIQIDELGKAGRKEGLEKQRAVNCDALDEMIALGLYQPIPRGTAGAARLIKLIFGSPLTEKGIAANIKEHHDDIIRHHKTLK